MPLWGNPGPTPDLLELSKKLGLAAPYSEGLSELDWCRALFEASDLPRVISWKRFLKKGYYVVRLPGRPSGRRLLPLFAEGRKKDVTSCRPCRPTIRKNPDGAANQSGKLEFESSSLKRFAPDDPERPPLPTYIPAWEAHRTTDLTARYPLQLISPTPVSPSTPCSTPRAGGQRHKDHGC